MIRLAMFVALVAGYLSLIAATVAGGMISPRMAILWADALLFADPVAFRAGDSFYPPLPKLLTLGLWWAPVPAPMLAAAGAAALLTLLWYRNLREKGGYSARAAVVLTAALALNPLFLRAVVDGPGMVLLILGTWIAVRGMMTLRLRGTAPDMMRVGLGLAIAILSHAHGLWLALAAIPALALAGRPSQVTASPLGYLFTMLFPVAVAVLTLALINIAIGRPVIPRVPWSGAPEAGPTLLALGVTMLPALVLLPRLWGRARYWMPMTGAVLTVGLAALANLTGGPIADPLLAAAPALAVTALALRYWPVGQERRFAAAGLAAGSVLLGAAMVLSQPGGQGWVDALLRVPGGEGRLVAQAQVVEALGPEGRVLVDAERTPGLLALLGGTERLILDGSTEYELAVRSRTAPQEARFVVLRAGDRLSGALDPTRTGAIAGLSLIHSASGWRVFERTDR